MSHECVSWPRIMIHLIVEAWVPLKKKSKLNKYRTKFFDLVYDHWEYPVNSVSWCFDAKEIYLHSLSPETMSSSISKPRFTRSPEDLGTQYIFLLVIFRCPANSLFPRIRESEKATGRSRLDRALSSQERGAITQQGVYWGLLSQHLLFLRLGMGLGPSL